MKMINFVFESLYQVVTWVFIGLTIGGIFYFLSKGNIRGVVWSSVGLICFVVIMIGIVADHYFFRSEAQTAVSSKERPYVFFEHAQLMKPLASGDRPAITMILANSGPVEATGVVKDISYYLSLDRAVHTLEYHPGAQVTFSLEPTARVTIRFNPKFVLTEEVVKAATEGKVWLFFYARGEYKDATGQTYPLQFCRLYDNDMPGNLINCDDGITFRESDKNKAESENKPETPDGEAPKPR